MVRYNGVNQPFECSSCPKKTFGDCHSLLIHSVLAHDKAYVMELHDQASPSEPIDNSLVQLLVPQVPLVQPNVTESDEAVAENVEINPPLGDSNAEDNEISRALETAALVSQEIKSPSTVKVVPGQSPKVQDTEDSQCQYCDRFFPNLDSVQNHIFKKHCKYCKLCNMMIKGNFEDHLRNSHLKQPESVIPHQKRGSSEFSCSGKKYIPIFLYSDYQCPNSVTQFFNRAFFIFE